MGGSAGRSAALVAAGIFISRILGFVRERAFAHYFGNAAAADAVRAALKIPNAIRNLLGEGTLSASFIPVYSRLLESEDPRAARSLAGAVASLLLVASAAGALLGIAFAPVVTRVVAPGFDEPTHRLTVTLVRILFPMSGLLILAAWCLGVLSSHRRFFLPYAAPTLWNVAQIAVMVGLGGMLAGGKLAVWLAWGTLAGALLQLGVQVPSALRLAGGVRFSPTLEATGVRDVLRGWTPVVIGAGVVQISSVVDTQLASLLGPGAVASLGYAQLLTNLPIALFGTSIAAAALPEFSRDAGAAAPDVLRARLGEAFRRVAFLVLPSAFAFAALGSPVVSVLFETGRFGAEDTALVTGVLAAYSLGLVGYATVKLFASAFYALGDTRTPVAVASGSVVLSVALALLLMRQFGPAGIALGGSLGATFNSVTQLAILERRVGGVFSSADGRLLVWVVLAGSLASGAGYAALRFGAPLGGLASACIAYSTFVATYLAATRIIGHPDAVRLLARVGVV
jgi:putative peptidoglycan lipid II flippase